MEPAIILRLLLRRYSPGLHVALMKSVHCRLLVGCLFEVFVGSEDWRMYAFDEEDGRKASSTEGHGRCGRHPDLVLPQTVKMDTT